MTYLDAFQNKETNLIHVVERVKGKRVYNTIKPEYSFYYPDSKGKYTSIYGDKVSKFTTNNYKKFKSEKSHFPEEGLCEADIKPVFKALESHYKGAALPELQAASLDIETDFCKERGFAPPEDPHQQITAVTIKMDWLEKMITLVLSPKTLTQEQAKEITNRFENCILCDTEIQLLEFFCELIEDVDVLYTWNGEGFDIPYIVNRTIRVLGKDYTRKLCLWDQLPKEREYTRFGKDQKTYDLIGRVHLDYMQLYKKFTYHVMPSYSLQSIGEYELGMSKIEYEGTLDQLYNNDFEKFIKYNRQDTELLSQLDKKLRFIGLANTIAHDVCVLFPTTIGSVSLTDQAIVLEAHKRKMVVPNRPSNDNDEFRIVGGAVGDPMVGKIHDWIGSVDITSLYPSTIRLLNMSPETLVAQVQHTLTDPFIRKRMDEINKKKSKKVSDDEDDIAESAKDNGYAKAWNGIFSCLEYDEIMKKSNIVLSVYFEKEKQTVQMTAKELHDWIFANGDYNISANGTIFDQRVEGIIPSLLTSWFIDRKSMQNKAKDYERQAALEKDDAKKEELEELARFWDQRNAARKVNLNALYGAISNAASRFADQRIGQSTTLSGRTITKHMNAKINEILVGDYNYQGKTIAYFDTDSCYFTIQPALESFNDNGFIVDEESFIELSETISSSTNETFPSFVETAYNIRGERKNIIKCNREICATKGIFPKKKRYALMVYDKEGIRLDTDGKLGKMKIMGMETKRSDTPKSIQKFLEEILLKVLSGESEDQIITHIRSFRKKIKDISPWNLGKPSAVNNLSSYRERKAKQEKSKIKEKGFMVPGHVQASLNWNELRKMNSDHSSIQISDGQKIVVCKLKQNQYKITSIAYPIDEQHLPLWFTSLPFDIAGMEEKMIDKKVENIIGTLGWNLALSKAGEKFTSLFKEV